MNYDDLLACLTTALFVAVVLAVLLPVAHLGVVDALSRLAHELVRGAGGMRRDAQALRLVRPVHAIRLAVADVEGVDAGSVAAGELVAAAGAVDAAQLVAAVATVVHTVTAAPQQESHHSLFCLRGSELP